MKLHFEPNLDFQRDAIEAVCDLFRGQEICRTEFTVIASEQLELGKTQNELGIGNRLQMLDDEIIVNLHDVQLRNGLRPSSALASGDFTGIWKPAPARPTFTCAPFSSLQQRFGFTKVVIVVPSVAIKERVYKTLQITAEHFRDLYANTPFEYFLLRNLQFPSRNSLDSSGI